MNENILVVAVHPDDETLGCGGTLLRHKLSGDNINWLIITGIGKENGYSEERTKIRNLEIDRVSVEYGFTKVFRLNYPATMLESVPKNILVNSIGNIFNEIQPSTIYLQHHGDAHSEHKAVFEAAFACTKVFRYPYISKVFVMETISETNFASPHINNFFIPNFFVDITDFLSKKIEIMELYEGEMGEHPFPRSKESLTSLATLRGVQCGVKFAEAFMVLKYILK